MCKLYNQWSVGGSPTFWQISNTMFNKLFGDEPSPLHVRFQAAVGVCQRQPENHPTPITRYNAPFFIQAA